MNEIFDRPLHTLALGDLEYVRRLADSVFVRLVQPFKQSRVVWDFDFRKTLKSAMRTGHMLPSYSRVEKTHPKSQLVIAMSLSGIDRCFAVGLIPLLSQLRKYLDFRLFIYTDDLIEAEFSGDGFIANDCDIAWNNVIAPVVFARLVDMKFDTQETKLLFIDSLGGGDSEWYANASKTTVQQARDAQSKYIGEGGPWDAVRQQLDGRYDLFDTLTPEMLPLTWRKKVAQNCESRWVETPALREYLIRYIFNPRFGDKRHGSYYPNQYDYGNGSVHIRQMAARLKEKFKSIHLLTPSFGEKSQQNLDLLKRYRFVDFHHRADSLEGFAQTLINIVYGRETDRLTVPIIKFANYIQSDEVGDEEEDASGHSELTKTARDCFVNCDPAPLCLPPQTHQFSRHRRGTNEMEEILVPYNRIDVMDFFPNGMDVLFGDWRIDPMWAEYGKIRKAEAVLKFIRENFVCFNGYNLEVRLRDESKSWDRIKSGVVYEKHRTRELRPYVEEFLDLCSKTYHAWLERLPLRHVVWCTVGKFKHECLAISACPADEPDRQKATVFHEESHWLEHACPAIGVFTNNLLQYLTGEFTARRLIPVGVGEYAMEALPGKTPWIVEYAGKWYRRHDTDLPNPTEIFSVHMEYFRSPEALVELMEHDVLLVKAAAFVLMGGPLALVDQCKETRLRAAMTEIEQRERKSTSYSGGGGGKKKKDPEPKTTTPTTIVDESKSFGI